MDVARNLWMKPILFRRCVFKSFTIEKDLLQDADMTGRPIVNAICMQFLKFGKASDGNNILRTTCKSLLGRSSRVSFNRFIAATRL